ncbi:MAG TPA: hypothetical protein VMW47_10475 [Verrucomicrobiae bacterium]|nr:hypothetical protein [Verrucomicrobiae bacterium]
MVRRVRTIRRLVLDLPGQVRLAYCLTRDPRVPRPLKLAAGAAVAVILTPVVNIPLWVPVVGEMDAVALLVLCLRQYNRLAPADVRRELEEALRTGTSAFDRDLASGGRVARTLARWLRGRVGSAPERPDPGPPAGGDPRPSPLTDPSSPAPAGGGAVVPPGPAGGTTTGDEPGGAHP